jgi:hypothetical protein
VGGEPLGIEVQTLTSKHDDLTVTVTSKDDTLALRAVVTHHDNTEIIAGPYTLTNAGGGSYITHFSSLREGTYQVTVTSAVDGQSVEPVSDLAIVWTPDAR